MGSTAGAFAALNAAALLAASALAAISAEEAVPSTGAASSSLSPAPLEPWLPSRTGTPLVSKNPSPPALDDDVCLPTPPAVDVKEEEDELRQSVRWEGGGDDEGAGAGQTVWMMLSLSLIWGPMLWLSRCRRLSRRRSAAQGRQCRVLARWKKCQRTSPR